MSKQHGLAFSSRARRGSGVPRGRLSSTLARRLGIRRLVRTSRQTGRLVSLLVLLILIGILTEFFASYSFFVYDANIRGNRLLSAEQIYEASGIEGYSIFWIQPKAVEASLEALPYIRAATVRCWLPNRVEILVEEREPIILWRMSGKSLWVDREGKAMEPLRELPNLIRLEDEKGEAADADGNMDQEIALGIQRIHQRLPEIDLFYYNRAYGLHFITPEGVQVYLGDQQDMAFKVRVFDAVRRQIQKEGRTVRLIDLRYRDEPYIR